MKGIIEFNLPEEEALHRECLNAGNYSLTLQEIRETIRQFRKYRELSKKQAEIVDELAEKIRLIMVHRDIYMDMA